MQMNEMIFDTAMPIDGYGLGFFRVGGKVIEGPVLALPNAAQKWGGLDDMTALLALADQVDVIFLGTGADIAHAPDEMRDALEEIGIGLEVMSSPSACRTYNILLSEGRRVAAALVPV